MALPPSSGTRPIEQPYALSEWYVLDTRVAESCEQGEIIDELRSSLRELARERGWSRVYIGGDNYFAWIPSEPLVRVSPDVYLLDNPPRRLPRSWQTWRRGHRPPRWAVEIVSDDWRKDYRHNPAKYTQLGTSELVLFDPEVVTSPHSLRRATERSALTVFRRGRSGELQSVYSGDGPTFSPELEVWLVAQRYGYSARLRLARDARATQLVPTENERTEFERQRAEREKQRADAEKRRADAEKRSADRVRARERELLERLRRAGLEPDDEPE